MFTERKIYMKKLYGITGLTGFFLMIGAAGGADSTEVGKVILLMLSGLVMMTGSWLLVKIHDYRARLRRRATVKKYGIARYRAEKQRTTVVADRRITTPELC